MHILHNTTPRGKIVLLTEFHQRHAVALTPALGQQTSVLVPPFTLLLLVLHFWTDSSQPDVKDRTLALRWSAVKPAWIEEELALCFP